MDQRALGLAGGLKRSSTLIHSAGFDAISGRRTVWQGSRCGSPVLKIDEMSRFATILCHFGRNAEFHGVALPRVTYPTDDRPSELLFSMKPDLAFLSCDALSCTLNM